MDLFRRQSRKSYPGPLWSVIAGTMGDFDRACGIKCDIDESSPSKAAQSVSVDALTRPFLVPFTNDLRDFDDDFVDTGALPLLKLPNLSDRIAGPDVI